MRSLLFILPLTLFTLSASASSFQLNYKNINTLTGVICASLQKESISKSETLVQKIQIEQIRTGHKSTDIEFEVSGTCNAKFDKKSKSIAHFGEEINLTFKPESITGSLGLNNINIKTNDKSISEIAIIDGLFGSTESIKVKKSNWAANNNIFTFSKSEKIKLELNRKVAAVEASSNLDIKSINQLKMFKIWSSQSFGCSTLSEKVCQNITEKL